MSNRTRKQRQRASAAAARRALDAAAEAVSGPTLARPSAGVRPGAVAPAVPAAPTVTTVVDDDGVTELVGRLLDPRRVRPVVVISSHADDAERYPIDFAKLVDEVGHLVDLVRIPTGALSRLAERQLPPRWQVFGGAGRSYPGEVLARPDLGRSPLRFPSERATDRLIADALGQAYAAGLVGSTTSSVEAPTASGEIEAFISDRAIVRLTGGGQATIARELTFPPLPLEWTLRVGQRVAGVLDRDAGRLMLDESSPDAEAVGARFAHHSVTLALVEQVGPHRAVLALHPRFRLDVTRPQVSPNEHDTVDLLLGEGEVVRVRVLHGAGGLRLDLTDVDDDEPIVAPFALVPDGPAWLAEGRPLRHAGADAELLAEVVAEVVAEPPADEDPGELPVGFDDRLVVSGPALEHPGSTAGPRPGPGSRPAPAVSEAAGPGAPNAPERAGSERVAVRQMTLTIEGLRVRLAAAERRAEDAEVLRYRYDEMRSRFAELSTKHERLKSDAERGRVELRAARAEAERGRRRDGRGPDAAARRALWPDAESWVRHEVLLSWVERTPASSKATTSLRTDFLVGPEFADSLLRLDRGGFAKAMRVAVGVLDGDLARIPDGHWLRTGAAGSPYLRRADGSRCARLPLERHTPQARRLHCWQLAHGVVEFDRVEQHDAVDG